MTNTNQIAELVGTGLHGRGILSRNVPSVEIRHESEGLAARFYVANQEKRGRMIVRIAIGGAESQKYEPVSIATAIIDTAVEHLGLTIAQN